MKEIISANRIRQITFYILLLFLAILIYLKLAGFLPAMLSALTFYIIMRGYMHTLVNKKKWKPALAATLLIILSFLVVVVPIGLLVQMLYNKASFLLQHSDQVFSALENTIQNIEQQYSIDLLNEKNFSSISKNLAAELPKVLEGTFQTLTQIVILYFLLYFLLVSGRNLESWLYKYLPLKDENVQLLGKELKLLVVSNAIGIPITALLQGVVALLGYWLLGVNDLGFWFVFTSITAMLPFVGAAMAYVPLSILFFMNGNDVKGILLLIYGFGIVGTVDNVFRFMLQKKLGDVHPLITVFGVIIGLDLFGFIGLIFGPILISLFILLVRIYINEFAGKPQASVEPDLPSKDLLNNPANPSS
jgi:predicted PurR-regulated permease PerM